MAFPPLLSMEAGGFHFRLVSIHRRGEHIVHHTCMGQLTCSEHSPNDPKQSQDGAYNLLE